jgi:purine-binding chemotaxis protein CheW
MTVETQSGEGQYLTFKLEDEIYAIKITRVREVLDYCQITRIPKSPPFMKGVINLRGGVVPVVDLRKKFSMSEAQTTVDTCIIIVEVFFEDESTFLGALADQVQAVLELDDHQIVPPPRIGTRLDTDFIKGMGKQDEAFIIILDIEKIFSLEELSFGRQSAAVSQAGIIGQTADSSMDKVTKE